MVLTDKDLQTIKDLLGVIIEKKGVVTKDDLGGIPTKDEFYKKTTKLLKEIQDMRGELELVNGRSSENRERITKIEKHISSN